MSQFIQKEGGLQAVTLAQAVLDEGPLAFGIDDRMWSYRNGVWSPDPHVVANRCTRLLGEQYRRSHTGAVYDVIRAGVPVIASDPVPDLINFRDGLLDWRAGAMRAHTPKVFSTVQLPVDYSWDADCGEFEAFLWQVLPEDMLPTAWELIGYLMLSGNPLHKAVMLTGSGRNGKGTFLRVMTALLGSANVTAVSLHDLVNTRFSTACLFGKIANIAGDIDAGYLENTALLKAVTGGDTVSAEHKGRDRFDFTPWAVPVFSANRVPPSADVTVGYLSRWLILPFPNSFHGKEDPDLTARLTTPEELTGIAHRGVASLRNLMERGAFEDTKSGAEAMEEFARKTDQVRMWLNDCAKVDPQNDEWVNRTTLYECYRRWTRRDGHRPVKASEFYDRLDTAPGVQPVRLAQGRGYRGVEVTDEIGGGWLIGDNSGPTF